MFLSYSITQPYYLYIENYEYNVIPGVITLTFDTVPSHTPADYRMVAVQGILMNTETVGFTTYDQTLSFSGNTASLTVPINMDSNTYMQFYYQDSPLPFRILCAQDITYETPAIFKGLPYTI